MTKYARIAVGSRRPFDIFDIISHDDLSADSFVVRKSGTTFTTLTAVDSSGEVIDLKAVGNSNLSDTYDRGDFINAPDGYLIKEIQLGSGAGFAYIAK